MKKVANNRRGQMVIESVLLMIVMLSIFIASVNALRDGQFLAKLIGRPWGQVAGMLECGVWGPPKTACQSLPGQPGRSLSLNPNL
ncbi:MAG TPA: hypothetical protein VN132_02325 [Bdellovibrio sp.]|nr:hypothetical protein [Bdellovibrio sp.]